ncbi:MAG TPA: hypothetical protein VJ910_14740 [Desulfuromonadales bacterium]|nr:hypothetical protein [Desulfuromonadales bacterium]
MNDPVSRKELCFWVGLLLLAVLAVILYNSWALGCGHCTWGDLLQIPWWGLLLLGANLAAGLALTFVSRRRTARARQARHSACCRCAGAQWSFCPVCGSDLSRI